MPSAFVDQVVLRVEAGRGGDGIVHFRREKYVPRGGPGGGNGGRGGNVVVAADPRVNTLLPASFRPRVRAPNGKPGGPNQRSGADAPDYVVRVPAGTLVWDAERDVLIADLAEAGQAVIAACGGRGGRGNAKFATARRQTPRRRELGEPGETLTLRLELRLLADVGLVGLPNAGKSTLLGRISAARPKVADYPFTTLGPVLGVVRKPLGDGFVVADLPGLIEGAHRGAGLGQEFLRHVRRTQALVHMLDVTSEDPWRDYQVINGELREYAEELATRPQVVALNKMDVAPSDEQVNALRARLEGDKRRVFPISALTGQGVDQLVEALGQMIERSVRAEAERFEPQEPMVYRHPVRPLEMARREDGAFVVSGTEVERAVAMADLELEESVTALHRALGRMGVLARLEGAGAQQGDTVVVGEREFDYVPDVTKGAGK